MSQNTQNPYFYTLDGTQLEIVGATYVYIFNDNSTSNESVTIANNETGQSINLQASCVMELSPDRGNTLQTLILTPNGDNLVYVTMIGGTAQIL